MNIKIKIITALLLSLVLFIGCGEPEVPTAIEDVTKRPSIVYQVDKYSKLPLKYPLRVGVLQLRDSRIMPFYGNDNFFKENDTDGLSTMAYLELKNSNMFNDVQLINEKVPSLVDKNFFSMIKQKYSVDIVLIGDVTSFILLRHWKSDIPMFGGPPPGISAFSSSVDIGMIGQLVYLDGAIVIWSGEVNRKNKLLVKEGEITKNQLVNLVHETQQQMFSDLMKHISKNGKRMIVR